VKHIDYGYTSLFDSDEDTDDDREFECASRDEGEDEEEQEMNLVDGWITMDGDEWTWGGI
jgi:hypothetical protein